MEYVNLNGQQVKSTEATLHISDLGLRRGYGVFEFFRVVQGVPVFIEDHLNRFAYSAQQIELACPYSLSELEKFIQDLIKTNHLAHAGIQMVLTGGYSEDIFTPGIPNLVIAPTEIKPQPAIYYQQGAKIILYQNLREIAGAKTTAYITAVKLAKRMKAELATEVVYHNGLFVSEGARSSLCIIQNGTLITAKEGVLPGITRLHMLKIAETLLPVEYRAFTLDELFSADEVILTGATREVMPITQIEDQTVAGGSVGPFTQKLMQAFSAHVEAYIASKLAST
jgi:branched-chain amino acid aminotransferase